MANLQVSKEEMLKRVARFKELPCFVVEPHDRSALRDEVGHDEADAGGGQLTEVELDL